MITFLLALASLALIYIRPGEIVPALAELRLPMIALVAGIVSAVASLIMKPRRFANLPIDLCFLGFMAASMLSSPANGRVETFSAGFLELLPIVVFYLLIRVSVQTDRQLKWFVTAMLALTLFQAANGIVQYWTGVGVGGATAVIDGYSASGTTLGSAAGPQAVRRVQGTGIFGDPNDLAMALVMTLPFLMTAVLARDRSVLRRLAALTALGVIAYALALTQSRGGFVAAGVLLTAYAYRRFGRATAVVALAMLVVAVLAAPGRIKDINANEESAQGRVQAWEAGLEMLKSKPVLGVGLNQFTRFHKRVAHNSFVHVMAETGLVGIVCFVGMFYWFFVATGPLRDVAGAAESSMARDLWASCIGAIVCACFLSRQYVPVLYVPLALGAARVAIEQSAGSAASFGRWWDWPLAFTASAGVVVLTFAAVLTLVA